MTKIRVRAGEVEVEYEGAESFLDKKLPELIAQLSALDANTRPDDVTDGGDRNKPAGGSDPGALGSFLRKYNASVNQMQRFLATSQWLHLRGSQTIKTSEVSKALQGNHQSRLGNPSEFLNKNVAKGFCEKSGSGFFVTEEGRAELG